MKCYLLEKRVRLLEDLLQLRKSFSEVSCQTEEDPEGSSPARTVVDHAEVGVDDTLPPEPSLCIEHDTVEVKIPMIRVKTEDKGADVLFYAKPIAPHFLLNPGIEERATVYDKKYVSLEALRGCVRELSQHRLSEDPIQKKDFENASDLLRFCEEGLPFYRRFEIEHHYGWEGKPGVETRHRIEMLFLFRFVAI